ncbi:hypothetical protein DPMN_084788 [Dreissena polymorpha]|uniref:Uncharacterized protein n=1 Tax=Dreissena polymorpha TaxID=45954 RepID=A0A9D3YF66_DREPO|nr:hypothetical protein DPMN_084788 [Dreissena polymorpha]
MRLFSCQPSVRSCGIGVGVALRRDVTVAREIRIRSTQERQGLSTLLFNALVDAAPTDPLIRPLE